MGLVLRRRGFEPALHHQRLDGFLVMLAQATESKKDTKFPSLPWCNVSPAETGVPTLGTPLRCGQIGKLSLYSFQDKLTCHMKINNNLYTTGIDF